MRPLTVLTNFRNYSPKLFRFASTEVITSKRDEYYKNLGKAMYADADTKPKGWDEALPFSQVPGPKPLPLIGNIHRFLPGGPYYGVPLHELYNLLHQQYGNIVLLSELPARKKLVCLYDPKDTEMLMRNEGPYPIRYGVIPYVHYRNVTRKDTYNGVGGVLSVQGEEWFKARSKLNPVLMEPRAVRLYVPCMDNVTDDLISLIKRHANNSPVSEMPEDFTQDLYKWAFENVAALVFDVRLGCLNPNLPKDSPLVKYIGRVNRMFELMFELEIRPSLYKYIPTPRWMEFVKVLDNLSDVNLRYIQKLIDTPDDPDIPEHKKSVARRLINIDKNLAVTSTVDMMIAGMDTTGKLLSAALYFLARYPETQKKLREEVLTKLPSKSSKLTAEELTRAPYLRAVIKETLRLAPVAVGVLRTTIKNLVLGGYQIPTGTQVLAITQHTSSNDEYFKMPKEFIPERWLKSMQDDEFSCKNVNPYSYLPFGSGPRQCIGKRFASLEVEVALLKIIRNFELSWPHEDMKFGSTLLYGIADPLKLRVQELSY